MTALLLDYKVIKYSMRGAVGVKSSAHILGVSWWRQYLPCRASIVPTTNSNQCCNTQCSMQSKALLAGACCSFVSVTSLSCPAPDLTRLQYAGMWGRKSFSECICRRKRVQPGDATHQTHDTAPPIPPNLLSTIRYVSRGSHIDPTPPLSHLEQNSSLHQAQKLDVSHVDKRFCQVLAGVCFRYH